MLFLELLAIGIAGFWFIVLLHTALGAVFIPRLAVSGAARGISTRPARVSIIFAYRDEQDGILAACRSMLAQDYPELEVIAVNDRSTDASAGILDALAGDPRLKRLQINELPAAWLGKNHALQRGSEAASGDWLLFTDADVVFTADAVTRSIAAAGKYRSDHLALLPAVTLNGPIEKIFYRSFGALFAVRFWPWAARFKHVHGYAGVGAFNLIRREAYTAIGEHRAIAMEVADDLMLAKRVKDSGLRLMVGSGENLIRVRWFVGWAGLMKSINKNAFRGFNYQFEMVIAAAAFLVFCSAAPALCLLGPSPLFWTAGGVSIASMILVQFGFGSRPLENILLGLLMPVGLTLFAYLILMSAWDAHRDQAVTWRGTRYPLELLKQSPPL